METDLAEARAATTDAGGRLFLALAKALPNLGQDASFVADLSPTVLKGVCLLVASWALRDRYGSVALGELAPSVERLWRSLDDLSSVVLPAFRLAQETPAGRAAAAVALCLRALGPRLLAVVLRSEQMQIVTSQLTARLLPTESV